MKKISVFLMAMGFTLGMAGLVRADGMYGKDITVTGTVVQAIVDDASGKVYILNPESANEPLPAVIKIGAKVTVDGDEITKGQGMAIRVERAK